MGLEFPLRSEAFLTVGGTRWYSALQENALYCEDLQTGDIRFVARFPTMDSFRLHGSILCVDDVLYFAPMKAEGLDVYDIKEKKMTRIPIPREKGGRFAAAVISIGSKAASILWTGAGGIACTVMI